MSSVRPEVVQLLRSTALFKNFTDTGLQIVGSIAQEKEIPAGAPLFVENMIGDGAYIIQEGSVRVTVRSPQGQDMVLVVLGPGESLGEAALLRQGPRLASATAEVTTRVLEIARRDLIQLQRSKPQAVLKLMMAIVAQVGDRMQATEDVFRQFLAWRMGM